MRVTITIIAILAFASCAASNASSPPVSISSRSRLPIPKGPRNYGPLGNLIAWFLSEDKAPFVARSMAPSDAVTVETFSEALGDVSDAATEQPIPRKQGDYGILGNFIARLFNGAYSAPVAGSPPSEPETKMPPGAAKKDGSTAKPERKHDYGLLGNLLVQFLQYAAGPGPSKVSETARLLEKKAQTPASRMEKKPDKAAAPEKPRKPNGALQSVRELVRLLSSNFLQDPVLFKAAEALKQRDRQSGIDAEPGHGGFITVAERDRLLGQAGEGLSF